MGKSTELQLLYKESWQKYFHRKQTRRCSFLYQNQLHCRKLDVKQNKGKTNNWKIGSFFIEEYEENGKICRREENSIPFNTLNYTGSPGDC